MSTPQVSVIIPTYNQAALLRQALDSLVAQTVTDWQAIVIDNHSIDDTVAVVGAYGDSRIQLTQIHNDGVIAASRNKGLAMATGEWVAFLDSDDLWRPEKLALCLEAVADDDADLVRHREVTTREGRDLRISPLYTPERASYRNLLFQGNCFSPTAVLVRRSAIEETGGFSEDRDIVTCEDYDLWLRLVRDGARVRFIEPVLSEYRLHGDNTSAGVERHMSAGLAVLDRHFTELAPRRRLDALNHRRQAAAIVYGAGRAHHQAGEQGAAFRCYLRSLGGNPLSLKTYAAMALALLPARGGVPAPEPSAPLMAALYGWIVIVTGLYLLQFRGTAVALWSALTS